MEGGSHALDPLTFIATMVLLFVMGYAAYEAVSSARTDGPDVQPQTQQQEDGLQPLIELQATTTTQAP